MTFLFNEQSAIENMIKMHIVDNDNIFVTIKDLARYNHFVNQMDKEDNYKSILKYLQSYGQNINEENVYKMIYECVQRAHKQKFKQVEEVCITKQELEFIKNLNNIKQEKIAFVLLASAKYYDLIRGTQYCTTYMKISDICKLARVTIPVADRNVFMQFAYDNGVLLRHSRAASTEKTVAFVSQDENDKIILRLKESDFKDLAYTYLAYKTPHQFRRCIVCKCWIKRDSKDRQMCKECSTKEEKDNYLKKEIQCIDCGASVYVSIFDGKTIRCEECQNKADYTPMETKTVVCVDCGKEFEVSAKNTQTTRCGECYDKYRRKKKTETMQNLRKKRIVCGQTNSTNLFKPHTTK